MVTSDFLFVLYVNNNIYIVLDVYVTEEGMFLKNIIVHHFKHKYIIFWF